MKLHLKFGLSFALLAVFAMGALTAVLYVNARTYIREDLRNRLHDSVGLAAMMVDAETHSTLTDPSQEGGDAYIRIKKTLQKVRDAQTDIRFVYTMRSGPKGKIVFVVDAESDPDDIAHLGEVYNDASALLKENFATLDRAIVERDFYTDKWGTWLTGYAPFYSPDGRREGVIGMDISYDLVISYERHFLRIALIVFAATIPCMVALGLWIGGRMAAPIVALTSMADGISAGDLDREVRVKRRDEIGKLSKSFAAMAARLKELLESLHAEIAERRATEEQLVRSKMESEFYLDLMSHDLTNYNQTVLINMGLLEKTAEWNEKQRKYLDSAVRQVLKSNSLISRGKAFSRVNDIKRETPKPMDLNELITEAVRSVKPLYPKKKIDVVFSVSEQRTALATGLLESVFLNLIENAVKHNQSEDVRIAITIADDGKGFWEVRIEDNGPGVQDELKEKIFERFERIGQEKGIGLGLSLVRAVIEMYGGKIRVEDRVNGWPGEGSAFMLTVPRG